MNPEERKKTEFLTKFGLYEHARMGFGMINSPTTFCGVINLILLGLNWKTVLVLMDDILVMGMHFEDHSNIFAEAFERSDSMIKSSSPESASCFRTRWNIWKDLSAVIS